MPHHHRGLDPVPPSSDRPRWQQQSENGRHRRAAPHSHRPHARHARSANPHSRPDRISRHGSTATGRGRTPRWTAIAAACGLTLVLAGSGFVLGIPRAADASTSGSAMTVSLAPIADAYVTSGAPLTSFGTSTQLQASDQAGHHKTSYLSFQVPTWTSVDVVGAMLRLTRTAHHLSTTVVANEVSDSSWDEMTLTAASAPAVGSVLDTQATNYATNTVSLDVRAAVRPGLVTTVALTSPSTDDFAAFQSREAGATGPRLMLTLTSADGGVSTPSSPSTSPVPTTSQVPPTTVTTPISKGSTSPSSTPSARASTSTATSPTSTSTSTSTSASTGLTPLSGTASTLFGAYPGFTNPTDHSESWNSRLARVSAEIGGKLPVVRAFQEGNLTFPNLVNPATGYASVGIISYTLDPSAVAAGIYDKQLLAIARQAPMTRPTVFCLDHEPEQTGRAYTAAQFVAGFRHFATVMRSVGNPLIRLAPIYEDFTIRNDPNALLNAGYWPGDAYADYFGVDAYYNSGIPKFTTSSGLFASALNFSAAHSKPLIVAEQSIGAGSLYGGEGWTDQQWTSLVNGTIATLDTKAFAVTWFETWKSDGDWRMDSSNHLGRHAGAIAAWSAVAGR